jgi:hypothetical protein
MRALDPTNVRFIDSMKLPAGQYAGQSLLDIAENPIGLLELDRIALAGPQRPKWCSARLLFAIQRFVTRPEVEKRIDELYKSPQ